MAMGEDLRDKVEQLCDKMEAVVGMWWTLDEGGMLKVAVTVTKQPRTAPTTPDTFVAESCKKQFRPGDTSAVSRVFTTKQQIWMPLAKNDTSYLRKDLAAKANIASIGLIHMDGGVFEFAFEQPRQKAPILHVSGEPLDECVQEYEHEEEGVIRWSQKKNSVLLSPAERKRRRLESNRAAAKRAYYRRLNKTETTQQENSQLREQLDEERSKVALYENLLQRLGINPAGALAAMRGQHALLTAALATACNQPQVCDTAHVLRATPSITAVPTPLPTQRHSTMIRSATCPAKLGQTARLSAQSAEIQPPFMDAPNTSSLSLNQEVVPPQIQQPFMDAPSTSSLNLNQTVVPPNNGGSSVALDLGLVNEPAEQGIVQLHAQQQLAELAQRQERELMSLEQQHKMQLSGASFNVNSTSGPDIMAVGSFGSDMLWTDDASSFNTGSSDDCDYSSAPE